MLMGNSIEGRFPFLDHRLVAFAAALPDRLRLFGLQEKYLLRRALRGVVPDVIRTRPKRPYRAPILAALVGEDRPAYIDELLAPSAVRRTGLFDQMAVRRLVSKCSQRVRTGVGEVDEMGLVAVVSTMLLHDALVANPVSAPRAVAEKVVVGHA
jgi:asparagine synthase (glutamine-hydrolysing)